MALHFYDGLANCLTNGRTPLIIVGKVVRWWRDTYNVVSREDKPVFSLQKAAARHVARFLYKPSWTPRMRVPLSQDLRTEQKSFFKTSLYFLDVPQRQTFFYLLTELQDELHHLPGLSCRHREHLRRGRACSSFRDQLPRRYHRNNLSEWASSWTLSKNWTHFKS